MTKNNLHAQIHILVTSQAIVVSLVPRSVAVVFSYLVYWLARRKLSLVFVFAMSNVLVVKELLAFLQQ